MKFLVCISQVPDTTTKITFTPDNSQFNTGGVQFIINPYDEIALTRAIELKEALGGSVTVLMVGKPDTEASIRKALAIGADDAIRVNADAKDAFYIATQIASVCATEKYDVVLTGKESIDYNGSQVGAMLAALTDMPFISYASAFSVEGTNATLEIEGR